MRYLCLIYLNEKELVHVVLGHGGELLLVQVDQAEVAHRTSSESRLRSII